MCEEQLWRGTIVTRNYCHVEQLLRVTIVVMDIVARDIVARNIVPRDIDPNLLRGILFQGTLIYDGAGSIYGGTGWYLVVLGQ